MSFSLFNSGLCVTRFFDSVMSTVNAGGPEFADEVRRALVVWDDPTKPISLRFTSDKGVPLKDGDKTLCTQSSIPEKLNAYVYVQVINAKISETTTLPQDQFLGGLQRPNRVHVHLQVTAYKEDGSILPVVNTDDQNRLRDTHLVNASKWYRIVDEKPFDKDNAAQWSSANNSIVYPTGTRLKILAFLERDDHSFVRPMKAGMLELIQHIELIVAL